MPFVTQPFPTSVQIDIPMREAIYLVTTMC